MNASDAESRFTRSISIERSVSSYAVSCLDHCRLLYCNVYTVMSLCHSHRRTSLLLAKWTARSILPRSFCCWPCPKRINIRGFKDYPNASRDTASPSRDHLQVMHNGFVKWTLAVLAADVFESDQLAVLWDEIICIWGTLLYVQEGRKRKRVSSGIVRKKAHEVDFMIMKWCSLPEMGTCHSMIIIMIQYIHRNCFQRHSNESD